MENNSLYSSNMKNMIKFERSRKILLFVAEGLLLSLIFFAFFFIGQVEDYFVGVIEFIIFSFLIINQSILVNFLREVDYCWIDDVND